MKLAIGDVVRDRSDMALGTVAGVASQADSVCVAFTVSGGGVRLALPCDLDLVARGSTPMTTARSAVALVAFVLAALAAVIGCRSAQELGAGWLLMAVAALGSYSAVMTAFQCWVRVTGPRRFRV